LSQGKLSLDLKSQDNLGSVSFVKCDQDEGKNTQTPTHLQETSLTSPTSLFPPKCYRCDFSSYETKADYEYHCVTRHSGLPAYPGLADIKQGGLTPQGMSWEN